MPQFTDSLQPYLAQAASSQVSLRSLCLLSVCVAVSVANTKTSSDFTSAHQGLEEVGAKRCETWDSVSCWWIMHISTWLVVVEVSAKLSLCSLLCSADLSLKYKLLVLTGRQTLVSLFIFPPHPVCPFTPPYYLLISLYCTFVKIMCLPIKQILFIWTNCTNSSPNKNTLLITPLSAFSASHLLSASLLSCNLVFHLLSWEELLLLTSTDPDSPFLHRRPCQIHLLLYPPLPFRTSSFFSAVSRSHAHHAFKRKLFADVVSGSPWVKIYRLALQEIEKS